jgi:hypothetical protein
MDLTFEAMFAGCFGDKRRGKRGLCWRKGWLRDATAWFASWVGPAPEPLDLRGF